MKLVKQVNFNSEIQEFESPYQGSKVTSAINADNLESELKPISTPTSYVGDELLSQSPSSSTQQRVVWQPFEFNNYYKDADGDKDKKETKKEDGAFCFENQQSVFIHKHSSEINVNKATAAFTTKIFIPQSAKDEFFKSANDLKEVLGKSINRDEQESLVIKKLKDAELSFVKISRNDQNPNEVNVEIGQKYDSSMKYVYIDLGYNKKQQKIFKRFEIEGENGFVVGVKDSPQYLARTKDGVGFINVGLKGSGNLDKDLKVKFQLSSDRVIDNKEISFERKQSSILTPYGWFGVPDSSGFIYGGDREKGVLWGSYGNKKIVKSQGQRYSVNMGLQDNKIELSLEGDSNKKITINFETSDDNKIKLKLEKTWNGKAWDGYYSDPGPDVKRFMSGSILDPLNSQKVQEITIDLATKKPQILKIHKDGKLYEIEFNKNTPSIFANGMGATNITRKSHIDLRLKSVTNVKEMISEPVKNVMEASFREKSQEGGGEVKAGIESEGKKTTESVHTKGAKENSEGEGEGGGAYHETFTRRGSLLRPPPIGGNGGRQS